MLTNWRYSAALLLFHASYTSNHESNFLPLSGSYIWFCNFSAGFVRIRENIVVWLWMEVIMIESPSWFFSWSLAFSASLPPGSQLSLKNTLAQSLSWRFSCLRSGSCAYLTTKQELFDSQYPADGHPSPTKSWRQGQWHLPPRTEYGDSSVSSETQWPAGW